MDTNKPTTNLVLPKVNSLTLVYHDLVKAIAELIFSYSDTLPTADKDILLTQADLFIRNTPVILLGLERQIEEMYKPE